MDRLDFLKRLAVPVAALGATKLDGENEEMDAQIVVNAPGVTINGAHLVSNRPLKTAIALTEKGRNTLIVGNRITHRG